MQSSKEYQYQLLKHRKASMRPCPSCKLENDDAQYYCAYCGTVLLNEREILESKNIVRCKPEKKFGLAEFLKEFQSLFVILGVFGALSFYLTSLFSSKDYHVSLFINNNLMNNSSAGGFSSGGQSFEIIGNISPLNNSLPYTPIVQADPIILLQIAMFCSFLFFFLVLAIIIKEANKIDSISKWMIISIMDILFVAVAAYIINTYAVVGFGVLFGIFFCLVMYGYFLLYKWINEKIKSVQKLEKFLFFIEPIYWLVSIGIVIFSLKFLNAQTFSDSTMKLMQIILYFALFGIFGGVVLSLSVYYYETINAIIRELSQFATNHWGRG
jgi:hypothetical protein